MQASTRTAERPAPNAAFQPGPAVDVDTDGDHRRPDPVGTMRGDGPLRLELRASLAVIGFTLAVCLATAIAFSILLHLLG